MAGRTSDATSAFRAALTPVIDGQAIPRWRPTTAYTAGQAALNPSGVVVTAKVAFTSGAAYNSANWNVKTVPEGTLVIRARAGGLAGDLAIRDALTAAGTTVGGSNTNPNPAKVFIDPGEYIISAPIDCPMRLEVDWGGGRERATLKADPAFVGSYMLKVSGFACRHKNLSTDANYVLGLTPVLMNDCQEQSWLQDFLIQHFRGRGLDINSIQSPNWGSPQNYTIARGEIYAATAAGKAHDGVEPAMHVGGPAASQGISNITIASEGLVDMPAGSTAMRVVSTKQPISGIHVEHHNIACKLGDDVLGIAATGAHIEDWTIGPSVPRGIVISTATSSYLLENINNLTPGLVSTVEELVSGGFGVLAGAAYTAVESSAGGVAARTLRISAPGSAGGKHQIPNAVMLGSFLLPNITGALPAASSASRGRVAVLQGAPGAADGLYVCKKTAADTYTWQLVTAA